MVQVNKTPVLPASRRPAARQVQSLPGGAVPGASRVIGLPLSVPPAPLAVPLTPTGQVPGATVRSPSYTPLYSRSRSNGPRSTSSFTPMPVSGPPSGPLASWTPSPASAQQQGMASTVPRNSLGHEAVRARSVSLQPSRDQEGRRYVASEHQGQRYEEAKKYGAGLEVEIGDHRFRCLDVLGKGSYSEVWRAEVLRGGSGAQEVALKEVRCGSQVELQQAIFEVQVLLALERSVPTNNFPAPRVPRCISYKVDPCNNGWKVRTAMTVVPGESLDVFIRHKPSPSVTRETATRRAVVLAAKLIRDIAPTLQLLAPIAWHRDVNSHNILIDTVRSDSCDPQEIDRITSFWLIDFGLAVDSQSWVTMHGRWRTEDIGGDSRYWPPSSWIMHLLGPEGFHGRQELCEQYQRRLDIHGLGITALELLCTIANASPVSEEQSQELKDAWEQIFLVWHRYREDVWRWWAAVYSVFSAGGDIAPVQAQMVRDRVVDQLIVLLSDIRSALRHCVQLEVESTGFVLSTIADMIDEMCTFELTDVPAMLGDKNASPMVPAVSPQIMQDGVAPTVVSQPAAENMVQVPSTFPASASAPANAPATASATAPSRTASSVVTRARPRSPSPSRPQGVSTSGSTFARQTSPPPLQVPLPWPMQDSQASRQVSPPPPLQTGPVILRQLSPTRGRSPTGARSPSVRSSSAAQGFSDGIPVPPPMPTPRDNQRPLHASGRSLGGPVATANGGASGVEPSRRASGGGLSLDASVTRYKSVSGFPSGGFFAPSGEGGRLAPRATSIDPHRHHSVDRSTSPQRWVGQSVRAGSVERARQPLTQPEPILPQSQPASLLHSAAQTQWTGVLLPVLMSQQRQASAARDRQPSQHRHQSSVEVQTREAQQLPNGTPQSSPLISTRNPLSRSAAVLPAPPRSADEEVVSNKSGPKVLTVSAPSSALGSGAIPGSRLRAYSVDRAVVAPPPGGDGGLLARSPRSDAASTPSYAQPLPGSATQLRAPSGQMLSSQSSSSQTQLPRTLPTPWLPPPRELSSRTYGGVRTSDGEVADASVSSIGRRSSPTVASPEGRDAAAMASRLTEAMAGLSAAVAAAQNAAVAQSGQQSVSAAVEVLDQSGDGDVGAGPPYPSVVAVAGASDGRAEAATSPNACLDSASDQARRSLNSQELKDRMRSLEAHGDEHEKLRERIKNLEESLQRLGRESLERAKLGMEKLAEKYFPKVRTTGPGGPIPGRGGSTPGLVLPAGASAGVAQVRTAYPAQTVTVQQLPLASATPTAGVGSATTLP